MTLDAISRAGEPELDAAPESTSATPVRWDQRVFWVLDGVVDVVLGCSLLIPAILVLVNVVTRTFMGFSLLWIDEVSVIGLNSLAFIGGALAYYRGHHIAVRLLVDRLPPRWQAVQRCAVTWVILVTAVLFAWYSITLIEGQWSEVTPVLAISVGWAEVPLAVGSVLLATYALRLLAVESRRSVLASGVVTLGVTGLLAATTSLWEPLIGGAALAPVLVLFVILTAGGVPVGFVLGAGTLVYIFITASSTLIVIPTAMLAGTGQFVLLAIPFFIFAGLVMDRGGVSSRLIDFVAMLLRRIPGGLMHVMIVSMYLFSGISGSKGADIAAVGSVMSRKLRDNGYDAGEGVAVLVASAAMGETVPPSIAMILLGSITTLSVGSLFIAGILPAAAVAVGLMLTVFSRARRGKLGQLVEVPKSSSILKSTGRAFLPLMMPVILFYGILSGIATPTEVSTVAVLYGLILAMGIYRDVGLRELRELIQYSTMITGMVLFLIGTAAGFSYAVTVDQIPQNIANAMSHLPGGVPIFMIVTILVLIVMGAILEGLPALLIFGPILLPAATSLGINPLQYGIVMIMGMGVGAFAPPLGVGLYIACSVCDVKLEAAMKRMWWYELTLLVGVLVLAFVPAITLALPNLFHISTI